MDICVGKLNIEKCFELDYKNDISFCSFFFQDTLTKFTEEELKISNIVKKRWSVNGWTIQ